MDNAQLLERFIAKHGQLLAIEHAAQLAEQDGLFASLSKSQMQRRGIALFNMHVQSSRSGLAGRIVVEFAHACLKELPSHQFKPGDIVKVVEPGSSQGAKGPSKGDTASLAESCTGVVYKVADGALSVAFKDDFAPDWSDQLRIIKLANQVSFERMKKALDRLKDAAVGTASAHHTADLISAAFGKGQPQRTHCSPEMLQGLVTAAGGKEPFYNGRLNDSQRSAVLAALNARDICLIHGPPGTGKTETLVEIIRQAVFPRIEALEEASRQHHHHNQRAGRQPLKVLVCGPSNLSVDNLAERLAEDKRLKLVRFGHPARMLPSTLHLSLDHQLAQSDAGGLVRDIRADLEKTLAKLAAPFESSNRLRGPERREAYQQVKDLRRELKQREAKALTDLLDSTFVVLATLNMAGSKQLCHLSFDVVIVDEGSQAIEAETWLALLLGRKAILAGDHQQLPPTIVSSEAAKRGLDVTLFARLIDSVPPEQVNLLNVQYRMNEAIMNWSNAAMYKGKLSAHESVRAHTLAQLPGVDAGVEETQWPLLFIDTAGCYYTESAGAAGDRDGNAAATDDDLSKSNEGEARLAVKHLRTLQSAGVAPADCAIITPYNAQVALIQSMLADDAFVRKVEIGSVDSFQGREKEAIIISLVRSNESGEIGFLSEIRRINVAITRARRHLCVIGDSATLSRNSFYSELVDYLNEHGEVQFPDPLL